MDSKRQDDFSCKDCGEELLYIYMVHDSLWADAGYKRRDFACIPCLTRRMGRGLAPEDLTDAPCNFSVFSKKPTVWGVKEEDGWKWVRVQSGLQGFLDFHHRRNLEYVTINEYLKG